MKSKFIENVYDSLTGVLNRPMDGIENAFESGSLCEKSYSQVYEAYSRLMERLSVDSEDADVEIIINSMLTIQRELCFKMYEYGYKLGFPETNE